jgi:hypothetical protein
MKLKANFASVLSVIAPACAIVLALVLAPNTQAQCGGYRAPAARPSAFQPQNGQPQLLRTSLSAAEDEERPEEVPVSIVGLWHVKFISNGITTGIPGGLAKGTEVDAGYSAWHCDGTEIMNSGGRAPNTGDFCLGVWERVGVRQYKLNHFAAAWDPTKGATDAAGNPEGALIGPGNIRENITLAPNGNQFAGTFTIDQYDESGNRLAHIEGKITGTRINIDTPESSVF